MYLDTITNKKKTTIFCAWICLRCRQHCLHWSAKLMRRYSPTESNVQPTLGGSGVDGVWTSGAYNLLLHAGYTKMPLGSAGGGGLRSSMGTRQAKIRKYNSVCLWFNLYRRKAIKRAQKTACIVYTTPCGSDSANLFINSARYPTVRSCVRQKNYLRCKLAPKADFSNFCLHREKDR
jgi:hypothetical protein